MKKGVYLTGGVLIVIILTVTVMDITASEHTISGTVNVGVISTTDSDYERYRFLSSYAENDLNTICSRQGLDLRFNFATSSGEGQAVTPLSIVWSQWEDEGTNLFVAGGWTSQLTAMRSFISDNEILVISPSSTTSQLAQRDFKRDYIYRLSPHDLLYPPVMARFIVERGIDQVLILGQESHIGAYGSSFIDEYNRLGGKTLGNVSYWKEDGLKPYTGYTECLNEAERILESSDRKLETGVLLLGFSESGTVILESSSYSCLSNVTWLSQDAYRYTQSILSELNKTPAEFKIISLSPVPVMSEKTSNIKNDFTTLFGEELDFTYSSVYDSCMLLGLSVLEADSVNSSLVREVLPDVAEDYFGLTGPCGLDGNGDRRVFRTGFYSLSSDGFDDWQLVGYIDSS